MKLNGTNEKTALEITRILAENGCTVEQSRSILSFVQGYVASHSTVQFDENVFLSEFEKIDG